MKAQLVIDRDTKKLCMQVSHGSFTATHELPADHKGWNKDELQSYLEKIVPELVSELFDLRRNAIKKVGLKVGA